MCTCAFDVESQMTDFAEGKKDTVGQRVNVERSGKELRQRLHGAIEASLSQLSATSGNEISRKNNKQLQPSSIPVRPQAVGKTKHHAVGRVVSLSIILFVSFDVSLAPSLTPPLGLRQRVHRHTFQEILASYD